MPLIDIMTSIRGRRIGWGHAGGLIVNGSLLTPPTSIDPSPIWANCPAMGADPAYFQIFDDFLNPVTTAISDTMAWTVISDGSTGTPVFQDAAGGIFNVVTAAADNDYSAYSSVTEPFLFASGKPLWLEARFKVAEATTDDSTWWVGLSDTLTTGGMQANTSGPLASYDGALIFTQEDSMAVQFETSNAGTQVTNATLGTSITDTWHKAGFYFDGTATTSKITPYFHNGTSWSAGAAHDITLSGLEEMHLVYGIKAGPGGAAETLQIDYIKCVQLR